MTQDKFAQARRKKEAYRGTPTDDNADCADLDKSDAQVINEQFLSHSTAKRDRTEKKDIYERAGVEEYGIVSSQGSVEIYYLEDGKHVLEQNYMLQDDKEDGDYNAEYLFCIIADVFTIGRTIGNNKAIQWIIM